MFDMPKSLFALLQEYYVIIKFSGQVVNFHVCPILNFLRSQAISIISIRSYIRESNELDFQMNVENVGSHISILRELINTVHFSPYPGQLQELKTANVMTTTFGFIIF